MGAGTAVTAVKNGAKAGTPAKQGSVLAFMY